MATLKRISISGHPFLVEGFKSGGTANVYFLKPEIPSPYQFTPAARTLRIYEGELAVKVPRDGSVAEEFAAECRSWMELKHKSFVPLLKVTKLNSAYAALMPRYESDLAAHILSPHSYSEISEGLVTLVEALHWAWNDLGVLHLDLKPENILIDRSPTGSLFSVSDWGMAKINEKMFRAKRHISEGVKVQAGSLGGTLPYMSPRRINDLLSGNDNPHFDVTDDVFSFGIILAELCLQQRVWSIYGTEDERSLFNLVSTHRYHNKLEKKLAMSRSPLVSLAISCCSPAPSMRPNYIQIQGMLKDVV